MQKKITILPLLAVFLLSSQILVAQKVEDAVKYIYYQRYNSAKEILQKWVAGNATDVNAQYWLGQAFLEEDNIAEARNVYQKALTATTNAPLILVGIGHLELLEGKTNDARQRFEMAINLTKGKKKTDKYGNVDILKAIGRANADGDSKVGEAMYGIEKLTQAAEIDQIDPAIYVDMGILYQKKGSDYGGQAVSSFDQALTRNPKYARAIYSKALVYRTQNNTDIFLPLLEQAVSTDPAYTPAYYALYDYYKNRDVNKAKTYLESYIANSDKDCKASFFYADYLFRAGKYQESLDKARQLQNGDCNTYIRINVLLAYDYDRLGDSVNAKMHMEQFIAKEDTNKILSSDYEFLGNILAKFPNSENAAATNFMKAVYRDTAVEKKIIYLSGIANLYRKNKNYTALLDIQKVAYGIKPKPNNRDIYDLGEAAYLASDYTFADSIFTIYKTKYPNEKFGYYWRARVAQAADTTMEKGLLVKPVEEYIQFLEKDKEKNKNALIQQYSLLAAYYANVVKDKAKAIANLQKILEYDPENADAKKYIDILNKPVKSNNPKPKAKPKK